MNFSAVTNYSAIMSYSADELKHAARATGGRMASALACLLYVGCSASGSAHGTATLEAAAEAGRSRALTTHSEGAEQSHCEAGDVRHEISEYDTSGDDIPDVRKVFLRVGDPPLIRLVLVCREADLNADGIKDVVRHYNEEGRSLREEADRNFDGQMDELTIFDQGRVVRVESDTDGNGRVDHKVFYEKGKPVRSESDRTGRSSETQWVPDHWGYYETGRLVRMGADLDGDGQVDRWDRDAEFQESEEEAEEAQEAQAEQDAQDAGKK